MQITPNFQRGEFACRDSTPYPLKWIDERLLPLCQALEKIREKVGRPLVITSGYRSPAHNEKVGGAKSSYHMKGMAVDFRVVSSKGQRPVSGVQLYNLIEDMIKKGEIKDGGLGKYKSSPRIVHYDIGPARRWSK